MRKLRAQLAFVVLSLLFWASAWSAVERGQLVKPGPEPVTIKARTVSYDRAANLVIAEGNVEIVQNSMTLRADKVSYNATTQMAEAWGNVVLNRDEDILRSQKLVVNLATQTGFVEDGELLIKKDNYQVTARRLEKTGPESYRVQDATFTTCRCGLSPPSWKISARDASITLGGFGKVRSAFFYLRDIPVLYIPWAFFPVVTERSTGFLTPAPGFSKKEGFKLDIPFFWAISRNMDATFDLDYRTKRGPKLGGEYRYILSESTRGEFSADFLDDRLVKKTRYTLKLNHDQYFEPRFYLRARGNFVREVSQLAEFEEELTRRAARQLESTALLVKTGSDFNLVNEVAITQELALPKTSAVPQAVPRTTLSAATQRVMDTPLFYRFDGQVANFIRGSGEQGQRLDFNPIVSMPFKLGQVLEFVPEAGFRETLYFLSGGDRKDRGLFNASARVSTELDRVYSLGEVGAMRHSLETGITYQFVERGQPKDLPFFDPVDRPQLGQAVTFFLDNRLFLKSASDGQITQWLRVRLSQSLALSQIEFNTPASPFPDLRLELFFTPPKNFRLEIDSRFDPKSRALRSFNVDMSLAQELLLLRYRFTKNLLEELDAETSFKVFRLLNLSYLARYSLRESLFLESTVGVGYVSACRCWSIKVLIKDRVRPDRTDVEVKIDLLGLGGTIPN